MACSSPAGFFQIEFLFPLIGKALCDCGGGRRRRVALIEDMERRRRRGVRHCE